MMPKNNLDIYRRTGYILNNRYMHYLLDSSMYAELLGKMNRQNAGKIFRQSMWLGLILSLAFGATGFIFSRQVALVLCGGSDIVNATVSYLKVMFVSTSAIAIM